MSQTDARAVAEEFFAVCIAGDFDTARRLLHDDVGFQVPSTPSTTPTPMSVRFGACPRS
jgi:ketosteroid isomerase-like protein